MYEKRNGKDIYIKSMSWFAAAGWLLMFVTLCLIEKAKPQHETFLDRFFDISVRSAWNKELVLITFWLILIGFTIGIIGIIINLRRMRRKDDKLRFDMVAPWLLTIIGTGLYLVLF